MDRPSKEVILNDEENDVVARVQGQGRAWRDPREDDAGRSVEE